MMPQETTSEVPSVGRRRWPIIALLLVVLGGITTGVLAIAGVFSGSSSGAEDGGGATPTVAATPVPPRADRLLARLRPQVEPPLVSSGGPSNVPGFAAAVATDASGQLSYWLATGNAPTQQNDHNALLTALPANGQTVFVLFDRRIPAATAFGFLDALRADGHSPSIAAGSPLGEDVFFGFLADGADSAAFRIQLGTRALLVHRPGGTAPEAICYNSVLPNDQLTRIADQALSGSAEPQVAIETAAGVELQQVMYLTQAIYRPGAHLRLVHSATDFTAPGCGP